MIGNRLDSVYPPGKGTGVFFAFRENGVGGSFLPGPQVFASVSLQSAPAGRTLAE